MSNANLFMRWGFPRAPLRNGIGRYVCQMQRVTFKFCKNHGSSRGVRDFIEHYLVDFAKNNPGVVVYLKPRRHRTPCMVAEYLNGEKQNLNCRDFNGLEVLQWLQIYRTMSGIPETRMLKNWHTEHPSIQGVWTPFTNRDPTTNVADLFDKKWSEPHNLQPTASEQLVQIFKQQNSSTLQIEENQTQ